MLGSASYRVASCKGNINGDFVADRPFTLSGLERLANSSSSS